MSDDADIGRILADIVERVLQLCDSYFADTRVVVSEREKELTSVVQVLRETLSDLAGQAKAFNVDLMRSTDRIGTLANVDDIRELKRAIASEARELKNAVARLAAQPDEPLALQTSASTGDPCLFEPGGTLRNLPEARRLAVDAFERRYLEEVLRAAEDRIPRAAELAGVSRRFLDRLVSNHGLRRRRGDG